MAQPIYVIDKEALCKIVHQVASDKKYSSRLAFGDSTPEEVCEIIASLDDSADGKVKVSKVSQIIGDKKTGKMLAGANKALEKIITEMNKLRTAQDRG